MRTMNKLKRYLPAILSMLMMAVLAVYAWCIPQRWDRLDTSRLTYEGDFSRSGTDYGILNDGPALTLNAGRYTLSWDIETDGRCAILIDSTNYAAISPSRIEITAEESGGGYRDLRGAGRCVQPADSGQLRVGQLCTGE